MIEGYVRVRLAHIDDPASDGTGGLVVALPGYEVQIYVGAGCLRAHLVGTGQLGWTDLPADRPLWLQLRRDAEGEMHFEYSADETNWVALASDPAPDFDDAEDEPTFGVFVGAAGLTRRFDEISTCLVP